MKYLILIALLFSGCKEAHSPQEALDGVIDSARLGKLSDFKDLIYPNADTKAYRTPDALRGFQALDEKSPIFSKAFPNAFKHDMNNQRQTLDYYYGRIFTGTYTGNATPWIYVNLFNTEEVCIGVPIEFNYASQGEPPVVDNDPIRNTYCFVSKITEVGKGAQ